MDGYTPHRTQGWIGALRAFAGSAVPREARCDLCSAPILAQHAHLLDRQAGRAVCACPACALLFDGPISRYRRIPPRLERLDRFQLTAAQWKALGVPVGLAFFRRSRGASEVLASYPGPAGAVEAIPEASAWDAVVRENPSLRNMQPEMEALLVNRTHDAHEAFLVSVDRCFELIGVIRRNWRGMSGGDAVRAAIDDFFARLREESACEVTS